MALAEASAAAGTGVPVLAAAVHRQVVGGEGPGRGPSAAGREGEGCGRGALCCGALGGLPAPTCLLIALPTLEQPGTKGPSEGCHKGRVAFRPRSQNYVAAHIAIGRIRGGAYPGCVPGNRMRPAAL